MLFSATRLSLKTLLTIPLLLLFATLLSSCATLKKGDCLEGDWASIGYKDGEAGRRSVVQLEGHKRACAKYKVTPDKPVYDTAYKKGLTQFCTKDSGYAYGRKSKQYYGVCPANTQKQFLSGYLPGLNTSIHVLSHEVNELRREQLFLQLRRPARSRGHDSRDHGKHDDKGKGKHGGKGRYNYRNKVEKRLDSIDSAIDSRRSSIRNMLRWRDIWAAKMK